MSEEIKEMTSEVVSYKCNWCGKLHDSETRAAQCSFAHAKHNLANSLLNDGSNLASIEFYCNFRWNLTEEQKGITKENCFVMSHWQCSKEPAYRIVSINEGLLRLSGIGGWMGYYGNNVSLEDLPEPHAKEELFVYKNGAF